MLPQLFVGNTPDASKFRPVRNRSFKPLGGLWTSTYLGKHPYSDWIDWCLSNEFWQGIEGEGYVLRPTREVNILTFESAVDLYVFQQLPETENNNVDYEALAEIYDGMHMSRYFIDQFRLAYYDKFDLTISTWDAESTLWFKWCFDIEQTLPNSWSKNV